MDHRSWLWRKKSSEKSNGETESSGSVSGSGSSPSERFSDDQQAYANEIPQSPEVSSKVLLQVQDEDVNEKLKIVTGKLCDAIAEVSAKEELVQQHAKVAEEAVTGWEKAENEVNSLKLQLDAATKKHSSLEDRIIHLDGALKECLRQLRQVKEDQDQKILEAIAKNSQDDPESESFNELKTQVADLRVQLQTANAKVEAFASTESDLRLRLGFSEKENASLRLKLRSLLEELEMSTKTAETVSKQKLESIKKVAKLESECRRLKSMAEKPTSFNHQKSLKQSLTISSSVTPSDDIGLMDDFLEMEKLAAQTVNENNTTEQLVKKIEILENERKILLDKCTRLEEELSRIKLEADNSKEAVKRELELTNAKKDSVELQLKTAEAEAKSLLAKVRSLELEVEKEKVLSAEFSSKCKKLEHELSIMKREAESRVVPKSKEELDIQQEKELSVAATKLAECQKTIASLGKQLKSLETFDDLFLESDKVTEVSEKESQDSEPVQKCQKPANLPIRNKVTKESSALPSEIIRNSPSRTKDAREVDKTQKSGFGKLLSRSNSRMKSRNL